MTSISNGRKLFNELHTTEGREAARRARDEASENGKVAAGRELYDKLHRRHSKETNQ